MVNNNNDFAKKTWYVKFATKIEYLFLGFVIIFIVNGVIIFEIVITSLAHNIINTTSKYVQFP